MKNDKTRYTVTNYDSIKKILTDHNFTVDSPFRSSKILFGDTLMDTDGKQHNKLRTLFSYALGKSTLNKNIIIKKLDSSILKIIKELDSDEIDFVHDIANLIPIYIVLELSGINNKNFNEFRKIALSITKFLDYTKINNKEVKESAKKSLSDLYNIIYKEIKNNTNKDNTVISTLIEAQKHNEIITNDFIVQQVALLIPAALDTTSRLISNMMFLLLSHSSELKKLRLNRNLMHNAINEVLRYEPPIRKTIRFVKKDININNIFFKKGALVELDLLLGNRDENVFYNPSVFNFSEREDSYKHLSFGYGPHICVGKDLASLIAERTFNILLNNFDDISLLEDTNIEGENFRGVKTMKIKLKGRDK